MITHASLPDLDGDSVSFHGELDVLSAPELTARIAELADGSAGPLLIDLSDCAFIDSLGIEALVDATREMQRRGRAVAIVCRSPQVRRTLAITAVDKFVAVCWSREEAIELLAEPGEGVGTG